MKGDAERPVYRSGPAVSINSLEFSPDRKSLAFEKRVAEANYMGRTRILVLDVETGATRTVLEEVINLADPWPFYSHGLDTFRAISWSSATRLNALLPKPCSCL